MKRAILPALVAAVTMSLLASPSLAAPVPTADYGRQAVQKSASGGAVQGRAAVGTANALAQRLRDKMPYILSLIHI